MTANQPPATPANPQPAFIPPAGFEPHTRKSPMTGPWEPIFARIDSEAFRLGLLVREAHCNGRGFAHGGMISALADNAMGLSAVQAVMRLVPGERRSGITVSLVLDFIDTAKVGDWLEIRPVVLKAGKTLAFTEGRVIATRDGEERLVARCSATFRMV